MVKKPGDEKYGTQKPDGEADDALGAAMSDEQFEQYLKGDSSISKAFQEMEQPEPPAAIDRAILAEAREATRPRRKSWLDSDLVFWRHWAKPLSTAVIMGVCLTVVLRVMDYASLQPPVSEDVPVIAFEQKSAAPMHEKRDAANEQTAAEFSANAPASPVRRMRAPVASAPAKVPIEDSMDSANDSFLEEIVVAREQEESSQEIVVTARKQAESLQEVPLAMTALTDADIAIDSPQRMQDEIGTVLADDGLQAWEQGARPAADVWLAGIEALYLPEKPITSAGRPSAADAEEATPAKTNRDPNAASRELAKMALVYPADARTFVMREGLDTAFQPDKGESAAIIPLADPHVWNAGIDWLYKNNRSAEATAELAKLNKVYPDF
jgi:hypothetical protein